jgi:hypothetical protein
MMKTDGGELRFAHRLIEQSIGLPSGILRLHIVRGLEIDWVDFRHPNERRNLQVGRGLRRDRTKFFRREGHKAAALVLIALRDRRRRSAFVRGLPDRNPADRLEDRFRRGCRFGFALAVNAHGTFSSGGRRRRRNIFIVSLDCAGLSAELLLAL